MKQDNEKWIFFSKIHPERACVSIRDINFGIEVHLPELGFKCRIETVAIVDSQIITSVELVEGETDIFTLRNVLSGHLRSLVDHLGFLMGRHFDIEVISATLMSDPRNWQVFGNTIPAMLRAVDKLDREMLEFALTNNHATMALADFRKGMTDATETGFHCYRAIESVMQSFYQIGDSESERWRKMREALNVDRGAIDFIKLHADDRRHGKSSPTLTDTERQKMFLITQAIIDRLFQLSVTKSAGLNVTEFPWVTGGA